MSNRVSSKDRLSRIIFNYQIKTFRLWFKHADSKARVKLTDLLDEFIEVTHEDFEVIEEDDYFECMKEGE